MCGIAGYAGIANPHHRLLLVHALGGGIDNRGGHAAGFVSVTDRVAYGRRIGTWDGAATRFIRRASAGHTCLMHARYATCGNPKDVVQAHPYAIQREGRTVLWGAHNGVVYDAEDSAKLHGRPYTVDSLEVLHLVANDDLDTLQSLNGYGVLTYIEAADTSAIKIARLSDDSEIVAARLVGGGVVYASTDKILGQAVRFAGLVVEAIYELNDIGRVYNVRKDGITIDARDGVKLCDWRHDTRWKDEVYWALDDDADSWDKLQLAEYLRGAAE